MARFTANMELAQLTLLRMPFTSAGTRNEYRGASIVSSFNDYPHGYTAGVC
jgi:hypothetical protein